MSARARVGVSFRVLAIAVADLIAVAIALTCRPIAPRCVTSEILRRISSAKG